jgi:hypothetical protein
VSPEREVRVTRIVYRYRFGPQVPLEQAEETLLLALYGAEGLHGAARVRLEAGYTLDPKARVFVVEGTTAAAEAVARIFTGFLGREFGEDAFQVERIVAEERVGPPEGPQPAGVPR